MNIQELFTRTNQLLSDTVAQVKPEQLDAAIPAYAAYHDGQTLKTYLNICAHENACVPRMLAGEKDIPSNQEFTEDYLKDDIGGNFAALTQSANKAVLASSEENLNRTVHMSYADASARDYLKDIVIQRSMAAIDIAQVANITIHWPDDLLQNIWNTVVPYAPTLRQYGVFPAEVSVSDDAPLSDKLVAIMGRQPQ